MDRAEGLGEVFEGFRGSFLRLFRGALCSSVSSRGFRSFDKLRAGREPNLGGAWRLTSFVALTFVLLVGPAMLAQSGQSGNQSQAPANSQSQDIPDAPSAVQPPAPKPPRPEAAPPSPQSSEPAQSSPGNSSPDSSSSGEPGQQSGQQKQPRPSMPAVQTVPPGSIPPATQKRGRVRRIR